MRHGSQRGSCKTAFPGHLVGKEFWVRGRENAKTWRCESLIWERGGKDGKWCGVGSLSGEEEGRAQRGGWKMGSPNLLWAWTLSFRPGRLSHHSGDQDLLRSYSAPSCVSTVLSPSHTIHHLIFTPTLYERWCFHPLQMRKLGLSKVKDFAQGYSLSNCL